MQRKSTKKPDRRQEYDQAEELHATGQNAAGHVAGNGTNGTSRPGRGQRRSRAGQPRPAPSGPTRPAAEPEPDQEGPELEVAPATESRAVRTEWLWRDRLEWRSVAIIQGEKGAGKSTWLRAIAADVTGGPRLPGEQGKPRVAGNVLWFAGEEPRGSIVHPGLAAAGADLARVFTADTLGDEAQTLALPNDCNRLAALIKRWGAVLVILDPIFPFLDGSIDIEGGTVPARRFTNQLMRVAAATGSLILYSRNLTKDTSRGALASGRGSGELGNAARSVLHVQQLPHSPTVYGLAVAACNSGRKVPTLSYTLEDSNGSGVVHLLGTCELTADELSGGEDADLDRSQLEAAKALIRASLPTGEVNSTVMKTLAEKAMITLRTLQLAGQRLGVRHRREGRRENTVVYWIAPSGGYKE